MKPLRLIPSVRGRLGRGGLAAALEPSRLTVPQRQTPNKPTGFLPWPQLPAAWTHSHTNKTSWDLWKNVALARALQQTLRHIHISI